MYARHYQNRTIQWCRYSDYAHRQLRPTKPFRVGKLLHKGFARVTAYSNGHPYAIVVWVGNKTPYQYHADFIEVFAETDAVELPHIPRLPVMEHMIRSLAWRAA